MLNPIAKLGIVSIARQTFDMDLACEKTAEIIDSIRAANYAISGQTDLVTSIDEISAAAEAAQAGDPHLLVVIQSTFADSTMILALMEKIDLPLLMWAIPEETVGGRLRLNSFCGINLAAHGLKRAGKDIEYVYAEAGNVAALAKLEAIALAAKARQALTHTRIGRVGDHPAGFETCAYDADQIQDLFGLEVVKFELNEIFDAVKTLEPAVKQELVAEVSEKVAGVAELGHPQSTEQTMGVYHVLKDIAQKEALSGFAVRCWPEFFTELGCAACGAMSILSNEFSSSSCEADVNGTMTQVILQTMSNSAAFGTDIVSFDTEADTAVIWHCGLAPSEMADPNTQIEATLHSNRNLPLLLQFTLKPGRVTLARLSEASGEYRMVIAGAEMVSAPPAFSGTSGTLRFDAGAQKTMDIMISEGLEHHMSVVYGDYRAALLALAKMLKIPTLIIE